MEFRLFSFAVLMSVYITQELATPSGLPEKSLFFRPRTNGLISFSLALLPGVRKGVSRYAAKRAHCFSVYVIAFPVSEDGSTITFCTSSHF